MMTRVEYFLAGFLLVFLAGIPIAAVLGLLILLGWKWDRASA